MWVKDPPVAPVKSALVNIPWITCIFWTKVTMYGAIKVDITSITSNIHNIHGFEQGVHRHHRQYLEAQIWICLFHFNKVGVAVDRWMIPSDFGKIQQ